MLKKYLAIYRYMFIRSLQFRTELAIYVVLDVLPFFVLLFMWQAAFAGKDVINGFTLPQITQYYFLVMFIERVTSSYFENWRSTEIREGKIDYFLTRPFSYINEILSKDLGGKVVSLLISIPGLLAAMVLMSLIIPVEPLTITAIHATVFAGFLILGYFMQFCIALWIVLLTFWFEGSAGLEHFKWISVTLFSGAMIPIEFTPEWLQKIYAVLPLKYIFAVPINYIQGNILLTPRLGLEVFFSFLLMVGITKILWSKAVYRYSSAGG
ncbi:MAG: ABC-2 family transporter protein [Pseudomonadales bacterium]|nr:ABC-2 family transporter protein [Pseudomonadales bacterium]